MPLIPPRLGHALEEYLRYFPATDLASVPEDPGALARRFHALPKSAATELTHAFGGGAPSIDEFKAAFAAFLLDKGVPLSESGAREAARFAGRLFPAGATVRNHMSRVQASFPDPKINAAPPEAPTLPREIRTAEAVSDWLRAHHFAPARKKRGSHRQWKLGGKGLVTVPEHKGDIADGTLSSIRRQIAAAFAKIVGSRD